jgi:tripartite-type tricarboxylate transporter receptor subunit TctC
MVEAPRMRGKVPEALAMTAPSVRLGPEEDAMKTSRRRFLRLAATVTALPALARVACANSYPSRPVRLVVATAAGGPADVLARLIGQWLSERLGQPFVIENRPGAGTNIATEAVVRAPSDGHTLLMANAAAAINATLYEKLNFNFMRDIVPVAGITRDHLAMVVNPSVPARTVPEFITYAKAAPGKVNMASGGNGAPSHMAGELFRMMAGVDIVHVPYRGAAPALTDLLGGQVQVYFGPLPSMIEYIKTGRLRALAVTTTTRAEVLPELPTLSDFLPGYEASSWNGICAPGNTARVIVDKLNSEINAALADPAMKTRLVNLGSTVFAGSPADFGKLIADDTTKWAKVIRFAGIKAN